MNTQEPVPDTDTSYSWRSFTAGMDVGDLILNAGANEMMRVKEVDRVAGRVWLEPLTGNGPMEEL